MVEEIIFGFEIKYIDCMVINVYDKCIIFLLGYVCNLVNRIYVISRNRRDMIDSENLV